MKWLALLFGLAGLVVGAPEARAAEGDKTVVILLDNSGSMKGGCGTTCRKCKTDAECPSALYTCGGAKRCAVKKEYRDRLCRDIWDDTVGKAKSYLKTLRPGTRVRFYTFDVPGAKAREAFTEVVSEGNKDDIAARLDKLRPNAQCTRLYDILDEVVTKLEGAQDEGRRLLFVFTDGDDDGSALSGRELRERLGKIAQTGKLQWQIVRPKQTLQDLCGDDPRCIDTPPTGPAKWTVTPALDVKEVKLSLAKTSVEGTLALEVSGQSLFPFEVDVAWKAADAASEAMLEASVPATLGTGALEGGVRFRFVPDLSRPRPETLGGEILISVRDGEVTLSKERLSVSFPVVRSRFAAKMDASGPYCDPAGTRVTAAAPTRFFNAVSVQKGYSALSWGEVVARRTKAAQAIGKLAAEADDQALHGAGQIAVTLSGRRPAGAVSKGRIEVSFEDKNGWVALQALHVPVEVDPDNPCGGAKRAEICGNGADDDGDGDVDCADTACATDEACAAGFPWWLLILGLLLLLIVAWLVLRKPDASFVGLAAKTSLGYAEPFGILKNGPGRLKPAAGSFALKRVGDPDELAAEGLEDAKVDVRVEGDGSVFIKHADPIFRRIKAGEAEGDRVEEVRIGRLSGGQLAERRSFRVLEAGPEVVPVDLRTPVSGT